MKRVLLFLMLMPVLTEAQNVFPANGNVGIGTSNPQDVLHLFSKEQASPIIEGNSPYIYAGLQLVDNGQSTAGRVKTWAIWAGRDGGSWLSGLGFHKYDAVNPCGGGICDIPLFLHDNGNVGIGTTNPVEKLSVNGNIWINKTLGTDDYTAVGQHNLQLKITNGIGSLYPRMLEIGLLDNGTGIIQSNQRGVGYNILSLNPAAGNVGIGTTTPGEKLSINGNQYIEGYLKFPSLYGDYNDGKICNSIFSPGLDIVGINNDNTYRKIQLWGEITQQQNNGTNTWRGTNTFSDNVGIGTTSPSEKLSVNGNIRAKKVLVTQTGWPDYVFSDSYNLPSLDSVHNFIKENKRLPEMPSAAVVEKEGCDVGEVQKVLLKKVGVDTVCDRTK